MIARAASKRAHQDDDDEQPQHDEVCFPHFPTFSFVHAFGSFMVYPGRDLVQRRGWPPKTRWGLLT